LNATKKKIKKGLFELESKWVGVIWCVPQLHYLILFQCNRIIWQIEHM